MSSTLTKSTLRFWVICFILFFISGSNVLIFLHYQPDVDYEYLPIQASFPPAVLVIVFYFILSWKKNYLSYKREIITLVIISLVMVYNKLVGLDMGYKDIIPSLCIAPLLIILLKEREAGINKNVLYKLLRFFYVCECGLAIMERIFNFHLFPQSTIYSSIVSYGGDLSSFRSTAFWGHPLANATVVTVLMCLILLEQKQLYIKFFYWILGFIAILCFNTRLAIVVNGGVFMMYCLTIIVNHKSKISSKIMIVLSLFVVVGVAVWAFSQGMGGRLLNMGLYDEGSASVRMDILSIFDYTPIQNFLLKGTPHDDVTRMMIKAKVENLIMENPWLIYLLRYGLLCLLLVIFVYYRFFIDVLKGYNKTQILFIMLPFLALISSFNSIASGGNMLTMAVLSIYLFKDRIIKKQNSI